jgi:metal-responsive CopG/Arc/MetJ family transcriptional regulator
MGKVNISASIDEQVDKALTLFCIRVVDNREYKLSKSEVVSEAIREYIIKDTKRTNGILEQLNFLKGYLTHFNYEDIPSITFYDKEEVDGEINKIIKEYGGVVE